MAHEHTFVSKDGLKTKTLTGMSAIKEKCMECCCWQYLELKFCPIKTCALYPFRFGKYPKKTIAQ